MCIRYHYEKNYLAFLHLQLLDKTHYDYNLVVELNMENAYNISPKNQSVDYIVNSNISSLILAQISENPGLEQVFDELGGKFLLNVELCNYEESDNRMLANQTVELIEKYKLVESVIVSSFRFNNLVYVKDKNPNISCALLAKQGLLGTFARNLLNHSVSVDALHPFYTDASSGLIRREQQCGRKVRAWTVNDPRDIRHLYESGVDAIFTDDPLNAREFYDSEKLLNEDAKAEA